MMAMGILRDMRYDTFMILSSIPPAAPVKAEIVDWGTDRKTYKVGDTLTVRVAIKNTGTADITTVEVDMAIEKEFLGAYIKLIKDHIVLPIYSIKPGNLEKYEQKATIPDFPGRYRVGAKVIVDGQEIADLRQEIDITR
jgi:hypothetical protein